MRRTKIICTIGPSTSGTENLVKLIESGMDAARLNFSHGTHQDHLKVIQQLREAEKITGKPLPIIQDLQGPKIRTGRMENDAAMLEDEADFIITCEDHELGNSDKVGTTYPDLYKDVMPGKILLLDDGYIILKVKNIDGKNIHTTVVKGGMLKNNKGIIAPGITISAPAISEKDIEDLKFGLANGVDIVALSFVRSERDIIELKTTMKIFGRSIPVIAKIERFEGYTDLDDIVGEADGIMVARGDLGLEMPAEEVPVLQKEIIRKCNRAGKYVITATQMLESMINNPIPTRAEASDVANAVLDGSDCVMLSGETSIGRYPFETVGYMDRIIRSIEGKYSSVFEKRASQGHEIPNIDDALGKASCIIAEQIDAAAIVALTHSGYTAKNISKYRPGKPILALTDMTEVLRELSLCWGVMPISVPEKESPEDVFVSLGAFVKDLDFINDGNYLVFVAGLASEKLTPENMVKISRV